MEQQRSGQGAASGAAARAETPGVTVLAYLNSPTYRAQQSLELTVELVIAQGLHIYGEPVPEGFIPLSIEVEPVADLDVGPLEGPAPRPLEIEGLDEPLLTHEGLVRFSRVLRFARHSRDQEIGVRVRYQACSETDCQLPSAVRLVLPVRAQSDSAAHG